MTGDGESGTQKDGILLILRFFSTSVQEKASSRCCPTSTVTDRSLAGVHDVGPQTKKGKRFGVPQAASVCDKAAIFSTIG